MASGKSIAWANSLLDLALGGVAFVPPATVYPALYTTAVTPLGAGTEASGGGYSRPAVTNNLTNWPAAVGGVKSNGTPLIFPTATGADWSAGAFMTYAALWDNLVGGTMSYFGQLTVSKPVLNGDIAAFPIGAFSVTET